MSLELLRTVQHRFDDGSETVNLIKVITYEEKSLGQSLTVGVEDSDGDTLSIHSLKHLNDLIAALKSAAKKVETWEEDE